MRGDCTDLALAITVDQHVGLGIDEHGASDLLGPVIVMCNAPQARLDAANDNGYGAIGFTQPLGIHDHASIGAPATLPAWRVRIIAAHPPIRGVAVDHGIHVAAGHSEEQARLAQGLEILGAAPVGLRDDANPKALRLQHAPDNGHTEARVIDIGVARDDDNVTLIPAESVHLGTGHRQMGGGARHPRD